MEQGFKNIAIVGGGASGCACAYFLIKLGFDVTIFDKGSFLRTLLPTGGGRCNLAHAEFNPRELATNYPRGEKFLYSVFSKFSTSETLEFFEELGIKTYIQENARIFPESNSAKDVRETLLAKIRKAQFVKEKVVNIKPLNPSYKLKTDKAEYLFDSVVVAIGGHSGYELAKDLGIKIVNPKPSLVGLNTKNNFKNLSGTVVKSVINDGVQDDILFTHFGISGPLIYKISSKKAFDEFPYNLTFDLCPSLLNLQEELNNNPHKEIKNVLSKFMPLKLVNLILKDLDETEKCHKINGKTRDLILNRIHKFEVEVVGTNLGEETVTAGGIDLDEINSKTMESKKYSNLYFIGEVLNIDGFCGGFNLQNAWSTAFVASEGIKNKEL